MLNRIGPVGRCSGRRAMAGQVNVFEGKLGEILHAKYGRNVSCSRDFGGPLGVLRMILTDTRKGGA
jgi:hypothetical protein